MEEFLLILRHEDGSKVATTDQKQKWMQQTTDWLSETVAQNKLVSRGN